MTAKTYTEAEVSGSASAAMDLILQGIECDQEMEDLLSLMVNATVCVLTSDASDLEEVVQESYGEELYEFKAQRGF